MLAEIAAEALRFLSRQDLDKTCAVNKWLDALIDHCCDVYPLRPVARVMQYPRGSLHIVAIEGGAASGHFTAREEFCSVDEAVHFIRSVLRHSYLNILQLGDGMDRTTVSPDHWTTLVDAFRGGAVENLEFACVDFSALDADAFLAAVGCRGLESLAVQFCVVPSDFDTNDLIRCSAAKGVLGLGFKSENDASQGLSDDAVLDFFFRERPTPEGRLLSLELENTGVTDTFLAKFLERLGTSPLRRPSGSLLLYGAPKQRGLSAYSRHLAPVEMHEGSVNYGFPSVDDGDKSFYKVALVECSSHMSLQFFFKR